MVAMEYHADESSLLCSCSFAMASECNNRGVDNLKGGNFRDGIQNFRKSLTLLRSLVVSDFCSNCCSCQLRAVVSLHRRSKNPRSPRRNSSKQQTIQQEKEEDTKEGQPQVVAAPLSNSAEPIHQYKESRWHAPLESHVPVFDDLLYIETSITPSSMPVALVEQGADSHQEDGRLEPSARGRHATVVSRRTLEDAPTDLASSVKGGKDLSWIPDRRSQEKAERVLDLIVTAVIFNCALANHLMMNRIGNANPQAIASEGTGSQRSKEKAIVLYRHSIALLTLEKPRPTSSLNDSPPNAHEQDDLMRDVILMASLNNLLCLMDQNDPQRQPFVSAFADFMHQCASKAGGALLDSHQHHQDDAQLTRAQVLETNNGHKGGDATQSPLEDLNNKWLPIIIGNAFLMQLESLGIICRSHSCSPAA